MSTHISRKSRWYEISPNRHNTSNGYVQKNPQGKWDAVVSYLIRQPINPNKAGMFRPWQTYRENIGEFKRSDHGS